MAPSLELLPEERLLAAAIKLALKDARTAKSEYTRAEARQFVWEVAPSIAKRADVPRSSTETR